MIDYNYAHLFHLPSITGNFYVHISWTLCERHNLGAGAAGESIQCWWPCQVVLRAQRLVSSVVGEAGWEHHHKEQCVPRRRQGRVYELGKWNWISVPSDCFSEGLKLRMGIRANCLALEVGLRLQSVENCWRMLKRAVQQILSLSQNTWCAFLVLFLLFLEVEVV